MCLKQIIYNEKHPAAFICYKRADDDNLPNLIREHLKNKYYFAFINHKDIPPGVIYNEYLEKTIRKSDNFILVITKSTFSEINEPHDFVCKEIRWALKYNKKIIPVVNIDQINKLPNENEVPSDIHKIINTQYIEYSRTNHESALKKIKESLDKSRLKIPRVVSMSLLFWVLIFVLFMAVRLYLGGIPGSIREYLKANTTINKPIPSYPDTVVSKQKTKLPSNVEPPPYRDLNNKAQIITALKNSGMDTLLRESVRYLETCEKSGRMGPECTKVLNGFTQVSDFLNENKLLKDSALFFYEKAKDYTENNNSGNALEYYKKSIKFAIPDFK